MEIGYLYNPMTLEYVGTIDLDRDPLDLKLMLPPYCTILEPKQPKENLINIYNPAMKRWEYMKDHRGTWFIISDNEESYSIEETTLNDIYDVCGVFPNDYEKELSKRIPYNYDPTTGILTTREGKRMVRDNPDTRCAGIPHKLLAYDSKLKCWALRENIQYMQDELVKKIKNIIDDLSTTIRFGEFEYQVDSKSVSAMQEKLLSNHNNTDKIEWVMANNEIRTISFEILKGVYTEYQKKKQNIFLYMQDLKTKIRACTTYNELAEVYDDFLDHIRDNENPQRIIEEAKAIFNG